jgi:hypothetical protein
LCGIALAIAHKKGDIIVKIKRLQLGIKSPTSSYIEMCDNNQFFENFTQVIFENLKKRFVVGAFF